MKKIIIKCFNNRAEKAYYEFKNKPLSLDERFIEKSFVKYKVVSDNPLVVEIRVKIGWLGEKLDLPFMIENCFRDKSCFKDVDYDLVIE